MGQHRLRLNEPDGAFRDPKMVDLKLMPTVAKPSPLAVAAYANLANRGSRAIWSSLQQCFPLFGLFGAIVLSSITLTITLHATIVIK